MSISFLAVSAYAQQEPPLLLELTSPGQLDGDFDDLDPQKAVQFEIGTRGALGERVSWDISLFDIEL